MSVSEKCVDKLFSLHNITLRSTISRLAEEFAGGNGFYPKILFIHPRWMIKDVARSLDNATPLFFPFSSFSNAFSVPTSICNHDGDAQSHKESERMAGRIETRISNNRRSRRVPIQSRNEVNPLYKYTRRKKKENRISLLRCENPLPRFPLNSYESCM